MTKRLFKYFTCLLLLTSMNEAFAQRVIDKVELKIGNEVTAFVDKVRLVSSDQQQPVALNDGSYKINNATQQASIVLSSKLINGAASLHPDVHTRKDFIIVNSAIQSLKSFKDDVLIFDVYRKNTEAHFREYDAHQKVKTEGYVSLDKQKHYGRGITKSYEDGKLRKISNSITETYTDFYPNGHKRSVSGPAGLEDYDETGALSARQYSKNNIRYIDHYDNGKLSLRSYDNADKSEVKEYYSNGLLQKKEVMKTVQGELRLFTYDQAGKLISNELYEAPSVIDPQIK